MKIVDDQAKNARILERQGDAIVQLQSSRAEWYYMHEDGEQDDGGEENNDGYHRPSHVQQGEEYVDAEEYLETDETPNSPARSIPPRDVPPPQEGGRRLHPNRLDSMCRGGRKAPPSQLHRMATSGIRWRLHLPSRSRMNLSLFLIYHLRMV